MKARQLNVRSRRGASRWSTIDAIQRFDDPEALIYCHPPYAHATRSKGATDVYAVEMSDKDHRELAEVLNRCEGRVLLSGYPSALYSELHAGWRRVDLARHARPETCTPPESRVDPAKIGAEQAIPVDLASLSPDVARILAAREQLPADVRMRMTATVSSNAQVRLA